MIAILTEVRWNLNAAIVKNQMAVVEWACAWVLYSVLLVFMSVLCQYHTVFIALVLVL
jgi:hypothetical protein